MTFHSNLNNHDAAWAPGGRASEVPITGRGANPLEDEPATPPGGDEKVSGPEFPNPDVVQLKRFHAALFKNADGGWLLLRAFEHGTQRPLFSANASIHNGDPQLISVVAERARQAAAWLKPAVFCPPVATFLTGENAAADNLQNGLTLSAECDEAPNAARERLTRLLGGATIATHSGGEWTNPDTGEIEPKVHLHWRLAKPTRTPQEHARLKEARSLMAQLTGADTTNINSVHPIRWPGSWHAKGTARLATIVSETDNEIDLTEALEILRDEAGSTLFGSQNPQGAKEKIAADPQDVARALEVIPNENLRWDDWNYVGMATWGATGGGDEGGKLFADWSAKSSKNDPEATAARWQHYYSSPPTRLGFGTLVYLARQHSPGWMPGGQPAEPNADPVDLWGKFDPPTLPRGILPDVIERFAFEQGRDMGADMAGIAVGALAVCAAAIPDRIKLQVKRHNTGWMESARIWVALVGPPSTKKSPIMSAASRPLRRIDVELARKYVEERSRYESLTRDEKAQTPPPKQTRLLLQDTTIEAAQEVLKDSPDGVLCYQDEMSGWFGSMDKYSSGRGAAKDRSFWLEAYNGGQYAVNRVQRGVLCIENLSVSLLGGIQPEPIRKIAEESVDDGLLQRLLPVVLKPAVEGRDEQASSIVSEYASLVDRLHHLDNPMVGGVLNPQSLRFDEGGQNYRQELESKHLELGQSLETVNRKLAAHIGKYDGIFARLCVIWHCVESEPGRLSSDITEATARRVGAFLHGFLLRHAVAFYSSVLGLSDDHDRLTAVAGHILAQKLDKITNRDIQRGSRTMRGLDKRETETVFEQLDALGWINRTPSPYKGTPPHWSVNPAVHTKFAERAKAESDRRARDRKKLAAMFGEGAAG
ncbi:DUF3987 domain-containing protein [Bradyrhizobium jicamae]|uniref:DUF3987 domain-containing protein n=1 Tax=Bradyrhizobium jicamae TaxID=280332 RepID=A0ABS5FL75_9BRAD|nr:DUF3987 domain-containing protein [Bradyrhizobium jicamae]MBR0797539.1 DUF3987 domain-containing protein [Bradyrhizobium jicamae]